MNWCSSLTFVLIINFVYSQLYEGKYEGDDCRLENGEKGMCVRLSQCSSAIEIVYKREHPETCSFARFTPIVCCPTAEIIKTRLSEKKCLFYKKSTLKPTPSTTPFERSKTNVTHQNSDVQQAPLKFDLHPNVANNSSLLNYNPGSSVKLLEKLEAEEEDIIENNNKTEDVDDVMDVQGNNTQEIASIFIRFNYTEDTTKEKQDPLVIFTNISEPTDPKIKELLNKPNVEIKFDQNFTDDSLKPLSIINIPELSESDDNSEPLFILINPETSEPNTNLNSANIEPKFVQNFTDDSPEPLSIINIPDLADSQSNDKSDLNLSVFGNPVPNFVLNKEIELALDDIFGLSKNLTKTHSQINLETLNSTTEDIDKQTSNSTSEDIDHLAVEEIFSISTNFADTNRQIEQRTSNSNSEINISNLEDADYTNLNLSDFGIPIPINTEETERAIDDILEYLNNLTKSNLQTKLQTSNSNFEEVDHLRIEDLLHLDPNTTEINSQIEQQTSNLTFEDIDPFNNKEMVELSTNLTEINSEIDLQTKHEEIFDLLVDFPEINSQNLSQQFSTTTNNKTEDLNSDLIFRESAAREGEFPHMAALGFRKGEEILWQCSGSLVSDKFVLTAAHCLFQFGKVEYVSLGSVNLQSEQQDSQQIYKVIQRIQHPLFKRSSVYHDIALLELERSVEFTEFLRPACLQTQELDKNLQLIATGWDIPELERNVSYNLQKVNLDIISSENCFKANEDEKFPRRLNIGIVEEEQFCAGAAEGIQEKDNCDADFDGLLQFKIEDNNGPMYTIVGIKSFGKTCSRLTGVYIKVERYVPWLETIIWPKEF